MTAQRLGDARVVVGASGAIFGLFGVLFAAMRLHVPMLDRRSRSLAGQVGFLIITSLLFGFAIPNVDNIAHIGGLLTGILIGAALALMIPEIYSDIGGLVAGVAVYAYQRWRHGRDPADKIPSPKVSAVA